MAITLHRFPLSHFSEKGRALLDFKGLEYSIREYTLGLPQRKIVKLSGQRQVPVIEHDGRVVSDSTRIAHYLDEAFPGASVDGSQRRLIPIDEPRRSEVLALEDRIDRVFGIGPTLIWGEYALTDRDHLDLIAFEVHGANVPIVRGAGLIAKALADRGVGRAFVERKRQRTYELLDELIRRLKKSPFLVGDEPTLADVAAVGLPFHLEFPTSKFFAFPDMQGRGITSITHDPRFERFFAWRREFYAKFLR